ncbi:MAG: nucleotidyltransferase domain-containing protein [Candidatus Aenigmatarchaeota archaeon]
MNDMFLSRSMWKLLNVMLMQPWKTFYVRELIQTSRTGPNTAIRLLKELQKRDIIKSQKTGNTISYSLNPENELTRKLLMLCHENRLNLLPNEFSKYISRLRRKLDIKNILSVVLFGSVSKGTTNELSDIDILIVYRDRFNGAVIKQIFEKYSRYVQIIDLSDNEFDKKYKEGNELIINAIKSGIIIYDRDYYYKYLFNPIPGPTKKHIEEMMKDIDEFLKKIYALYRKGKTSTIEPLLYMPMNLLSTTIILLNNRIPESKKDIIKQLNALNEKEVMKCYNMTKRIWEGETVKLSSKEIENMLLLIENKLKECHMKLEGYDDKNSG